MCITYELSNDLAKTAFYGPVFNGARWVDVRPNISILKIVLDL